MTIFVFVCAGAPAAYAANFACTWNDGTANWTAAVDWSTCNSAFPNNGQPSPTDTYDGNHFHG